MPKKRVEADRPSTKVSLHTGASFHAAWETVLLPWFQAAGRVSWQQRQPTLVAVPFRSQAYAIKGLLLDRDVSLLGIRFVSPAELRELLAARSEVRLALREHLRLLLSIAAEECMKLPEDPALREKRMLEADFLAAKSVARAPDHLLRTIDQLGAAGWDFSAVELPALREIATRFQQRLADCGFELIHTADRRALSQALASPPAFANILVTGFNGAHWPLWPLLQAAVVSSKEATVLLDDPRDVARDIEETWVGTWEEAFGEAKPISLPMNQITDSLFSEEEMRGASVGSVDRSFVVGADTTEQAEAVAQQCLDFLADAACDRVGIVFSGAGALPRLVANALARLDIPHHDGVAHFVPGIFEAADWRAWLRLQESPRINSLLHFVNALSDHAELFSNLSLNAFERTLRSAYAEVLIDDLDILRRFCAQESGGKKEKVAAALDSIPFLPARARFSEFLLATKAALNRLGWKSHWMEISRRTGDWVGKLDIEFSRALYLRWLGEIAFSFTAARETIGDHPYARVQLLTVAQAQNREWSHLIFAGWNEGSWPPPAGAEFARAEEIRVFNRSVQQLNKRAAGQGSQGEGHTSVRENHSLYLGPSEQRAIALRQFDELLESASEGVTLAASLVQEDAPERFWNPSECFTELYLKARHEPLTQATLKHLQRATAQFINDPRLLTRQSEPPRTDVQQTLIAFDARRDASKPASEYDFALRTNQSYRPMPTLSVSDLERMVSSPAIVWMKRYLGVEAPDDTANPWATTSGKWVHRWLASISETKDGKLLAAFPSSTIIDERVRVSADERRAALQQLCDALGKVVPDWWNSGWLNARYLARYLGGKIASVEGWSWMTAEVPIGREGPVKIADEVELQLRGQIDLVLAQNDAADFTGQKIWIVDYKTGSTKELKTSDLHDNLVKGTTLQLGLYALAVRKLGAAEVNVSILSLAVKHVGPQLSIVDLAPHTDVFADLAEMQRTGIFGMKGEVRPAFGYSTLYPLATLQFDNDILEDKWALTHPALVLEKEEWEIW